jgi:hypothetical protein
MANRVLRIMVNEGLSLAGQAAVDQRVKAYGAA